MLSYRGGSVIYFQGDVADKVCIVQQGSVRVTYENIETGYDEQETLQPGEFFGVKSALGRYNREENAIAVQDSVIMTMSVGEFEQFAMANTRIIMKMLKVFSNQLRRVHRQVASLMVNEEQPSPEAGLFGVGEYYLKNKRYAQARYVFGRYLTYYPAGKKSAEAAKGLEITKTMLSTDSGAQAASLPPSGTGFIADGEGSSSGGPPTAPGKISAESAPQQLEAAKVYSNAVDLIEQKKYPRAYTMLRKIAESGADQEYAVKSGFEIGRCLFLMEKFNECIQYLGQVISNYPKHPELGTALFFMGQSYEKTGGKDKAAAFYKKALTVTGEEDEVYSKAKQALKDLEA
jgi:TolA-binding protein